MNPSQRRLTEANTALYSAKENVPMIIPSPASQIDESNVSVKSSMPSTYSLTSFAPALEPL